MASIKPHGDKYRAQICVKGIRESEVFATKREAAAWAAARETELRRQARQLPGERHTLDEALTKYAEEVAPTHRGARWEIVRIELLRRYLPVEKRMARVEEPDIAAFRDARLKEVSEASVLRELKVLMAVFEAARRDWKWVESNPVRDVRKPRSPEHRRRVISRQEIHAMLKAMGYSRDKVVSVGQAAAVLFLLSLRTGMRAGELCGLEWSAVFEKHLHLAKTKTVARDVPLSRQARRLLALMRGWDEEKVFGLSVSTLDSLFRRYRERAGLSGFTFHDSRHTAATWIAKKLDVLTLCKMFGWSDPKMAMIYYNPKAEDIADRL